MSSRINDENVFSARRGTSSLSKKPLTNNENSVKHLKSTNKPSISTNGKSVITNKSETLKTSISTKPIRTALTSLSKPSTNSTPISKTALVIKSNNVLIQKPISTLDQSQIKNLTKTPKSSINPSTRPTTKSRIAVASATTPQPTRTSKLAPKSTKKSTLSIYTPAKPTSIPIPKTHRIEEDLHLGVIHPPPELPGYDPPTPIRKAIQGDFITEELAGLENDPPFIDNLDELDTMQFDGLFDQGGVKRTGELRQSPIQSRTMDDGLTFDDIGGDYGLDNGL